MITGTLIKKIVNLVSRNGWEVHNGDHWVFAERNVKGESYDATSSKEAMVIETAVAVIVDLALDKGKVLVEWEDNKGPTEWTDAKSVGVALKEAARIAKIVGKMIDAHESEIKKIESQYNEE